MATATHVELSTTDTGVFHVADIKKSSAAKASEVLQASHDNFHCFFNAQGFHNHIPHHILTIYALGADPQQIQNAYDHNKGYQRPPGTPEERFIEDMRDRKEFLKYLGEGKYYIDFLTFFQSEIQEKGVGQTFQEHVFAGDDAANAILGQLLSGYLHPIIHTGFGIEFNQPAIIAEGLAMAAVSSSYLRAYFDAVHKHISSNAAQTSNQSLFDLLPQIQSNDKLAHCAQWDDGNKIRDGLLARAPDEMVEIAAQWRVDAKDLERKTAEMTNYCAYYTCAAQNPKKRILMDFFFMHCMNTTIFFHAFLKQGWMSDAQKCKLLEMKGWVDMAMYASHLSPELFPEDIRNYREKLPGDWDSVFRRVNQYVDDGHTSKFVRALANGEQICKAYEEAENWPIQGPMWLKMAHMVIDSVEGQGQGARWGRHVGFPQAWEDIADRDVSVNASRI